MAATHAAGMSLRKIHDERRRRRGALGLQRTKTVVDHGKMLQETNEHACFRRTQHRWPGVAIVPEPHGVWVVSAPFATDRATLISGSPGRLGMQLLFTGAALYERFRTASSIFRASGEASDVSGAFGGVSGTRARRPGRERPWLGLSRNPRIPWRGRDAMDVARCPAKPSSSQRADSI
jgi:hypothetical protein